jgi:hypothetical protein
MNQIIQVRAEIEHYFNPKLIIPEEHNSEDSPSGNYSLELDVYAVDDPNRNWRIAVAEISDRRTGEVVARVKCNDDRFFHGWIERDGTEYLICAEDLEGQTVIDLTHRQVEGYSDSEDKFIWTEFHLSPDKSKLAISGCYWGAPYLVVVYNFSEPLRLPLERVKEVGLYGKNIDFEKWISNDVLSVRYANESIQVNVAG